MNSLIYGGIYTLSGIENKVYILLKEEANIVYVIEFSTINMNSKHIRKELRSILSDVDKKNALNDNILKANKIDFINSYDGFLGKAI